MSERRSPPLRIFYAAGPGDVVGTYRHWKAGVDDPSEVAVTYSGQFYSLCRDLGAKGFVVSYHPRREKVIDDQFRVEHRPLAFKKGPAPLYHLGQIWAGVRMIVSAIRFRADVAVVSGGTHWFMLTPLRWFGITLVPTLHCMLWRKSRTPRGVNRFVHRLNARFFRARASVILSLSDDITRQLGELIGVDIPLESEARRGRGATDEDLMRRVQQGDRHSFTILQERYRQSVSSYLFRMLGSSEKAESLARDVFLRASRYVDTYHHPQKASVWLFSIARALALDAARAPNTLKEGSETTGDFSPTEREQIASIVDPNVEVELLTDPEVPPSGHAVGDRKGTPKIISFLPSYRRDSFENVTDPQSTGPFNVLYAGRIEANKGVYDLLNIATRFASQGRTDIEFDLCGSGSALEDLRSKSRAAGVDGRFRCHGHLTRERMLERYSASHVVIAPTTSGFIEGFNKVVAEAVLAGRPVITSAVCPALEYVRDAVMEVPADDVKAYGDAIVRLREDPAMYESKRAACAALREQFFDPSRSWGAAVMRAVDLVTKERRI